MAHAFQIKLGGHWQDYSKDEDKILKRAFLAGFPNARYSLRGQKYEVDFKRMAQKNFATGKEREIRPPHKMSAPTAPICEAGPTICIKVPEGAPGTTIQVPHPKAKGQFISVSVPVNAKVGQAMLVPLPDVSAVPAAAPAAAPAATPAAAPAAAPAPAPASAPAAAPAAAAGAAAADAPAAAAGQKAGWSTGAKVAAGVGGVAVVGGLAVAGALLGAHIADEGWDTTMAELGDGFGHVGGEIGEFATEAGDTIATTAVAAGEGIADVAEDAGHFIMDLF